MFIPDNAYILVLYGSGCSADGLSDVVKLLVNDHGQVCYYHIESKDISHHSDLYQMRDFYNTLCIAHTNNEGTIQTFKNKRLSVLPDKPPIQVQDIP